jgi:methionyl-tRNA formyltransferase
MKIGFFGTPEIASFCLERLMDEHEILFVVCSEDKPAGRNRHIQICAAKDAALCHNIPFLHPVKLRDPEFIDLLRSQDADIFVVVAYGRIIPAEIIAIPRFRIINLHPSLLPRYRGAAPVQWSLINGETVSGITVQDLALEVDSGDIILQETFPVGPDVTAGELYQEILPRGAGMLLEALRQIEQGAAVYQPQDHTAATFCGKIDRETAHIDWTRPAASIHNLVRGLNPRPGTWTTFRGMTMKIWRTAVAEGPEQGLAPGECIKYNKRLVVGTGEGFLEIREIQPETKKIMDGISFLNGHRIAGTGECFH